MTKSVLQRCTVVTCVLVAVIAALALGAARAQASPPPTSYSVEDLGTLGPPGNYGGTQAYAINGPGTVVGYSDGGPCTLNGFVWDVTIQGIPDDRACSSAYGINSVGHVAGSVDNSAGGGCYLAFRLAGGVITKLPALPSGETEFDYRCADGYDVNDADVVVGNVVNPHTQVDRPAYWDAGNRLNVLPLLPNATRGWANGVNTADVIVGDSGTPTGYWEPGHAFRYQGGLMEDLNNVCSNCGVDWDLRDAADINDSGQIVGYGFYRPENTIRAFRFAGGKVTNLGTFPTGGISYALDANNAGVVVGAAYLDGSGTGNFRAAIYDDRVGTMQNLNDLIPSSSGWVLRIARGINDSGQIVGWGEHNGEARAFRLTPKPALELEAEQTYGRNAIVVVHGSGFSPNNNTILMRVNGTFVFNRPAGSDAFGELNPAWATRAQCGDSVQVEAHDPTRGASDPARITVVC